jgi:RNA polymerase sigma factor (TIGR02999 family)
MEEAAELASYLPLSFKSPKEQEYIEFLWDAFDTNYTHGKYQFAFLAYHMLTMSFVYFNIWQIKQTEPDDFEKGLIGFGKDIEKSLLGATSPFVFSTVNERTMLRFLKLIACDNGKIGAYAKLVDDRNDSALVHEAWLRLTSGEAERGWNDRTHFFAAAAEAMRRILVDNARRKRCARHGGDLERVELAAIQVPAPVQDEDDLLAVHEALDELAALDPRKAELVKLRFFVGLNFAEAAEVLGISEVTAKRDWAFARAWLYRRSGRGEPPGGSKPSG